MRGLRRAYSGERSAHGRPSGPAWRSKRAGRVQEGLADVAEGGREGAGGGEPFEAALHSALPRDFDHDPGHGLDCPYTNARRQAGVSLRRIHRVPIEAVPNGGRTSVPSIASRSPASPRSVVQCPLDEGVARIAQIWSLDVPRRADGVGLALGGGEVDAHSDLAAARLIGSILARRSRHRVGIEDVEERRPAPQRGRRGVRR